MAIVFATPISPVLAVFAVPLGILISIYGGEFIAAVRHHPRRSKPS